MKVIIAPDSFKGTMTSVQVIERIKDGIQSYFKDSDIYEVPIADGGEGTVAAITEAMEGSYHSCYVQGPYGKPTKAVFGVAENTGILEMAESSGIILVEPDEMNPLKASTYGTGEMIRHALDSGVTSLVIGIGGSATNDGGIGMAAALGVRFYDAKGQLIDSYGGERLADVDRIDMSLLDKRLDGMKVTVICDVTNPLTGEEGATYVYGPQKGADYKSKPVLEAGMVHYRDVLKKTFRVDMDQVPGAGAAGGLGAALVAYLKAELKPGVETILDMVDFDTMVQDADLVITGEGRLDGQSVYGKVPVGVAKRCIDPQVPVVAIAGCTGDGYEAVYTHGIDAVISTVTAPGSGERAMARAEENLDMAVDRMLRTIGVGIKMAER